MRNIAIILFMMACGVVAQEVSYVSKIEKIWDSQELKTTNWKLKIINNGKVPITVKYTVKNQRHEDGGVVTTKEDSGTLYNIKPGDTDDDGGGIFTILGQKPEIDISAAKEESSSTEPATKDAPLPNPFPGLTSTNLNTLEGQWVVKSGPGIGEVDSEGHFGIKEETIRYLYIFNPDKTGTATFELQNKLHPNGSRTTYTWMRDFTYVVNGDRIVVSYGPGRLVSGDLGTTILPKKRLKLTFTQHGSEMDIGEGWALRRYQ